MSIRGGMSPFGAKQGTVGWVWGILALLIQLQLSCKCLCMLIQGVQWERVLHNNVVLQTSVSTFVGAVLDTETAVLRA